MVSESAALLHLPGEIQLPLAKTHSELVKFSTANDTTFKQVVQHLESCLRRCAYPQLISSWVVQ